MRERAGAVVDHHYDDTNPHKPLWLMFPGGAVAVIALLWAAWGFYNAYFGPKPDSSDLPYLPLLLLFYFGGVFAFSYGYELYDVTRALKLTLKIGLIGLALVVIILVLGFAIAALGKRGKAAAKLASSGTGGGNVGSALGRLLMDTAVRRNLVTFNAGEGEPRGLLNVSLPNGVSAGECSFCGRPLPPGGRPSSAGLVDSERYCPKCGQPFEPAGEIAARAAAATAPPAPPAVPVDGTQASCLKCGVFGRVGADGLCSTCVVTL